MIPWVPFPLDHRKYSAILDTGLKTPKGKKRAVPRFTCRVGKTPTHGSAHFKGRDCVG